MTSPSFVIELPIVVDHATKKRRFMESREEAQRVIENPRKLHQGPESLGFLEDCGAMGRYGELRRKDAAGARNGNRTRTPCGCGF